MPQSVLVVASIPPNFRTTDWLWVAAAALLAVVLAGATWPERFSAQSRGKLRWLALALAAGFFLIDLALIATNVRRPRDWDFKYFWVWGVAAAEGSNPYDHDNLLRIAEAVDLDEDSKKELYGFYPPPALLMFAPLGWLPFRAALVAWEAVELAALAACLVLMSRLFLKDRRLDSVAPVLAVALAFHPTAGTFYVAQSNFLVLLALLLFWRDRERPIAGAWVALGFLVKPLVAAAALYLVLRGRWRAVAAMAGTMAVLLLATAFLLGPQVFTEFADRQGISTEYPITQPQNQSLTATVLRATGATGNAQSLLGSPLVLAANAAVVAATSLMIVRLRGAADPFAVGMTLTMMLMIYPGALAHYGVYLLPPLALVLGRLNEADEGRALRVALIVVVLMLAAFKLLFWGMVLVWFAMAWEGLRVARAQSSTS